MEGEKIKITDYQDPCLDVYARLTEAQLYHFYEPHGGLFIAESGKVIERALAYGCEPVSILLEELPSYDEETLRVLDQCGNIPVYVADHQVLSNLRGFHLTRGILCAMKRPAMKNPAQILADAGRIAVLENVVNPTNVGALFRSAAALGMDGVLLTSASCDPLYRRSIRVSMGTVFQLPWAIVEEPFCWPDQGMELLKEHGFKTVAMALREDSLSLGDERLYKENKLAVVLGTEGDGLAAATIAECDYTVKIPMSYGVDSLNVAAAGAVAFWELGKRL